MRLALVSDIHGNLAALEAVRADIRRRGVDAVLNLGDSLSGPLLPKETAQCLMAEGWFSLAGNHERQMLQTPLDQQGASDAHASAQLGEAERANALCELNVIEQVVNVCVSTVMVDAWARGQQVSIHGWAFGVHDGLLQDLRMTVSSTDSIEPLYRAAIEGVIAARR